MRPDVSELREFYDSRLGRVVRRLINRHIRSLWPNLSNYRVLGLGYATPYLAPFLDQSERVFAFMSARQGVTHWPAHDKSWGGLTVLTSELQLPLDDNSVDRILMVHGLENSEQSRPLMREVWRVLAAGGRLLIIAPNRTGIWSRTERTPFGHGQPYSQGQLARLLRDNMFQPTQRAHALYFPPLESHMLLQTAGLWERLGPSLSKALAGIHLMEADKQIYAATLAGTRGENVRIPAVVTPLRRAASASLASSRRQLMARG